MRRHDWPERLAEFIEARRHAPFAWGLNDCASFAADAAAEQRWDDPLAELRNDRRGALAALRYEHEIGGMRAALTRALGEPKAVTLACRGDVLLFVNDEGRDTLAVCLGEQMAGPGVERLAFAPLPSDAAAWSV